MSHTPATAAAQIERLRGFITDAGRDPSEVEITVMGRVEGDDDVAAWAEVGVDRLIVVPWRRSSEAIEGMQAFAERHVAPVI
jgi:alkanesulfonate monooxygenase SsuD/methylene tetrahydromethanopterin reductase-like flavin-dependent oxidoreductase (luciferase family)